MVNTFCILLQKNLLLLRRNWVWTIFELVLPILITLLLCFLVGLKPKEEKEIITIKNVYGNFEITAGLFTCTKEGKLLYSVKDDDMEPHARNLIGKIGAFERKTEFNPSKEIDEKLSVSDGIKKKKPYLGAIIFKKIDASLKDVDYTIVIPVKEKTTMHHNWYKNYEYEDPNNEFATESDSSNGYPNYQGNCVLDIQRNVDNAILKENKVDDQGLLGFRRLDTAYFSSNFLESIVICGVIGMIFPVVLNAAREMAYEKEMDIKGFLAVYGVSSPVYYLSHLVIPWIKAIIVTSMSVIPLCKVIGINNHDNEPVFVPILITCFIYSTNIVAFATFVSVLVKRARTVTILIVFFWGATVSLAMFMSDVARPWKIFLSFGLNGAYIYSIHAVSSLVTRKRPINFSSMYEDFEFTYTVGHSHILMTMNTIILVLLAVTFEIFGMKLKGKTFRDLFGRKPSVTSETKPSSTPTRATAGSNTDDGTDHEVDPGLENQIANIEVVDMHKIWPSGEHAVNGLNLKAYNGQVTVLLGHNGAGKSTTFNILCKIVKPTSGVVEIKETQVGLCQQTNCLFRSLTVKEHLRFFHRLKGSTEDFNTESGELLRALSLEEKMNGNAGKLSGGQKRKLCVAIALIGRSKVVLLDEPTAGMDPGARREVVALLEQAKKDRTILLTTHYMDEAEVLADRIIIMAQGKAVASGTTDFLKKRFGTGYVLTIVLPTTCTDVPASSRRIKEAAESVVSGTTIGETHGKQFDIVLPRDKQDKFGDLFLKFETEKETLQIESFGLSINSLEQVFLKVGEMNENEETKKSEEEAMMSMFLADEQQSLRIGPTLILFHILGLFYKRALMLLRNYYNTLEQIIIPIIIMILASCLMFGSSNDPMEHEMSVHTLGPIKIFSHILNSKSKHKFADIMKKADNAILFEHDGDLAPHMNSLPYRFPAAGFGFDTVTNATNNISFLYKDNLVHALPTMQNIYANMIGAKNSVSIRTSVRIVRVLGKDIIGLFEDDFKKMGYDVLVLVCLMMFIDGVVVPSVQERVTRFRHQQLLTPLSAVTYWIHQAVFDTLIFILLFTVFIICWAVTDAYGNNLKYFVPIVWLFHFVMIPFAYLVSFVVGTPTKAKTVVILTFVVSLVLGFGLVMAQIFIIAKQKINNGGILTSFDPTVFWIKALSMVVLPVVAVFEASLFLMHVILASFSLIEIAKVEYKSDIVTMKSLEAMIDFMVLETKYGIVTHAICLLICFVVFTSIFVLSRVPFVRKKFSGIKIRHPNAETKFGPIDEDVQKEEEDVQANGKELIVNVNCLRKSYGSYTAVNGVTFGVRKQECFGLLGQNGAGKTSTFDIITGLQFESGGSAEIEGIKSYRAKLGYCPQFDALLPEMTGRETLVILSMFHGYHSPKIKAEQLLKVVGLGEHGDKLSSQYSGGQRRKLSIAVSILSQSNILIFDEPTAGIDPKARRDIWTLLSKTREHRDCAMILTSHSMDECEALCTRIGILKKGKMIAIGSSQHLKSKYSNSYTANIVLKHVEQRPAVEQAIALAFPGLESKTNDFSGTLNLKWTIPRNPSDKWSELWLKFQKIALDYDVKDYCLTQSSLEDTFLKLSEVEESQDAKKK